MSMLVTRSARRVASLLLLSRVCRARRPRTARPLHQSVAHEEAWKSMPRSLASLPHFWEKMFAPVRAILSSAKATGTICAKQTNHELRNTSVSTPFFTNESASMTKTFRQARLQLLLRRSNLRRPARNKVRPFIELSFSQEADFRSQRAPPFWYKQNVARRKTGPSGTSSSRRSRATCPSATAKPKSLMVFRSME